MDWDILSMTPILHGQEAYYAVWWIPHSSQTYGIVSHGRIASAVVHQFSVHVDSW